MNLQKSWSLFKRFRESLLRGVLFIIPVWLTLFVVGLLYSLCETWLGAFTEQVVRWVLPTAWLEFFNIADGHIPGLSLVMALFLLAAVGMLASWHVGRQGLRLIDHVFLAIPGLGTIYSSARKIIDAVGEPGQQRFQKVVLIGWPTATCKVVGFVTNEVTDKTTGKKQYFVFVPTVPNPTAGFVVLADADDVIVTDYTPEDGLKLAMSLGVIAPPHAPSK
jgi:uncharacterized membrane protein